MMPVPGLSGGAASPPRRGIVWRVWTQPVLRREADMMGLTAALALLAALTAGNDHDPHGKLDVLVIVWGTTVGLGLAHWFALTLSVRLVTTADVGYTPIQMLWAQVAMALVLAVAASAVVLLVPLEADRLGARTAAALFIGVLVGTERRLAGASWPRAVGWALGAVAVAMTIATLKWFVGR